MFWLIAVGLFLLYHHWQTQRNFRTIIFQLNWMADNMVIRPDAPTASMPYKDRSVGEKVPRTVGFF